MATPVFSKVRPLFGEKKTEIEQEILSWEKEGIIRRVAKPVKWASPIHSVKKPNGKWRVCGDFRRLNAITEMDRYPLPSIQDFNARLAGCKIFSKVDLRRAYQQVEIKKKDQEETTINTTLGLFEFLRMPYGLKNAGQCFQRNIHSILSQLPFVFGYMDDAIIGSRNENEHISQMKQLFEVLNKNNIVINYEKCQFAKPEIEFLGHIVSERGISVPEHRVITIKEFPTPQNVKQLERDLGIFAFVHRFIRNASGLSAKLHTLRSMKKENTLSKHGQQTTKRLFKIVNMRFKM